MVRTTRLAEALGKRARITDWVEGQRRRKWMWAGQIARRGGERWATEALNWIPKGRRIRGHPVTRWEDDINDHCKQHWDLDPGTWRIAAQDEEGWGSLLGGYCGSDDNSNDNNNGHSNTGKQQRK